MPFRWIRGVVVAVAASSFLEARVLQPVVAIDPGFVIGRDILVVSEGRAFRYRVLVRRDLDELAPVVYPGKLHRDKGGRHPQKAGLDAYVLGLVVLVEDRVVLVRFFQIPETVPAFLDAQLDLLLSR